MPVQDATFFLRRGTAAAMSSANPVLRAGEPAVETDTGKGKIGDGTTTWNTLSYAFGPGVGGGGAVSSVNSQTGAVVLTAGSVGAAASVHGHVTSDITLLAEYIRDTIAAALVAGTNMTVTVDDTLDTITLTAASGGGGAVSSVNGQTGTVSITLAGLGAAAAVHNHTSGDITNFAEAVQDVVGPFIVAGSNMTVTYNDVSNTLTLASTAQISTLTYANAPIGARFDVPGNPVASTAARPNARTDIFFDWETSDALMPVNALDGDNWLNAVEGP